MPTLTTNPTAFILTSTAIGPLVLDAGGTAFTVNATPNFVFGSLGPVWRQPGAQLEWRNDEGAYLVTLGDPYVVSVVLGTVEGANGEHEIMRGHDIHREAVVTGLAGGNLSSDVAILQAAEAAVIAVTGDRGSYCPDVDVPTYLVSFRKKLVGNDCARVEIHYRGYPLPTYEFDGALEQVESNLDRLGNPVLLSYTYPTDYILDKPTKDAKSPKAGLSFPQSGKVRRQVNEPSFTIHWLVVAGGVPSQIINGVITNFEGTRTATEVMTWFENYNGKVNDATYTIGLITGARRTWMCKRCRGSSKDGGNSYEASMTLQYRKATWDDVVPFINSDDGQTPTDVVAGTSTKQPEMADEANLPTIVYPEPN